MEWYRDNGVLKVRFGNKAGTNTDTARAAARAAARSRAQVDTSYGNMPKQANAGSIKDLPKPSDYNVKRNNGVFAGFEKDKAKANSSSTDKPSNKSTQKSSSMTTYAKTLQDKGRVEKAKIAAARKATPEAKKELKVATRIRDGKFKGKYYGPDEFKGNTKLIAEWKKAGKPNRQAFARSRGLSGTKD